MLLVLSTKRRQVGDELVQLIIGELHRRHERAGSARRIRSPRAQIFRCVGRHSRPSVARLITC